MKLRKFNLNDYEEVVSMHHSFISEVFEDRKINPKYFFHKEVMSWINDSKDIVVAYKDETIVGYTMCYLDQFNGLTEPVYTAEICYVKPEYRKTKAAYLLYKNGYNYSIELGVPIVVSARVESGVDVMIEKHFNLEKEFITYKGVYNG